MAAATPPYGARPAEDGAGLLDERRTSEELGAALAHFARVAQVGELCASILHEIRQPLASIAIDSDACQRWLARSTPNVEEARACLTRVTAGVARAGKIIDAVGRLVSRAPPNYCEIDANELLRGSLKFLDREIVLRKVAVEVLPATQPLPVLGDEVQLAQVLTNLVLNALQAMDAVPEGGRRLRLSAALDGRGPHGRVVLTVEDTGSGLGSLDSSLLFRPFFTTRQGGMGLGLSLSQSIAEAHGGTMRARQPANGGAAFDLVLPCGRLPE